MPGDGGAGDFASCPALPAVSIRNGKIMKQKYFLPTLLVLLALVAPALADNNANAGGSSYVCVSAVTVSPEVFYPYEQGTVAVTLTNNGNCSVGVTHPTLLSATGDLTVVNEDTWQTLSYLGSGNTITYTFQVTPEGTADRYYPLFSVETKDGQNIHYPVTLKVDATDITTGISKKPETFTLDSEAAVNLSLINPRDGEISRNHSRPRRER